MATALNFLVNFWKTIDENGSMTWTNSDNHISILFLFINYSLNLQKFLNVLNSYVSSFGLAQRGRKLSFKMQVSDWETWNRDYFEIIEFVVRKWFFLGEKNGTFSKILKFWSSLGSLFFFKKGDLLQGHGEFLQRTNQSFVWFWWDNERWKLVWGANEFLKLRLLHQIILQILFHVFLFFILEVLKKKNENSYN